MLVGLAAHLGCLGEQCVALAERAASLFHLGRHDVAQLVEQVEHVLTRHYARTRDRHGTRGLDEFGELAQQLVGAPERLRSHEPRFFTSIAASAGESGAQRGAEWSAEAGRTVIPLRCPWLSR